MILNETECHEKYYSAGCSWSNGICVNKGSLSSLPKCPRKFFDRRYSVSVLCLPFVPPFSFRPPFLPPFVSLSLPSFPVSPFVPPFSLHSFPSLFLRPPFLPPFPLSPSILHVYCAYLRFIFLVKHQKKCFEYKLCQECISSPFDCGWSGEACQVNCCQCYYFFNKNLFCSMS